MRINFRMHEENETVITKGSQERGRDIKKMIKSYATQKRIRRK